MVLPARNEAALIVGTVERVGRELAQLGRPYEIIVADSASTDGTGARVHALMRRDVRVVYVAEPGKGAAVSLGLRAARGRYVGFLDSDLEIAASELPRLVAALDEGADAAIASKIDDNGDRPFYRRVSTTLYNTVVRALFGTGVRDHQAGMKLFRGAAVESARAAVSRGWFWDTEVLVALHREGRTIREVPVRTSLTRTGRLSVGAVGLELLRELLRLYLGPRPTSAARGDDGVGAAAGREGGRRPGQGAELAGGTAWAWLAAAACALGLALFLQPRLLLSPGVPAGYDTTGHVYPTWLAVQRLLHGRPLHGWSTGWYTGFPLFYFYFPLPALLTAALTPLLGFAAAFKATSVLGIVAFPVAVCWLLLELRLRPTVAPVAVVIACGFLFTRYFDLGANIPSTLGGEFAYALSFTLSIAYLAAVLRGLRRPDELSAVVPAALLLAATALSHLITTAAVVLCVAPLLRRHEHRRVVLGSWSLAFLLAAFWVVPFLARASLMSPAPNPPPPLLERLLPGVLLPVLPLAAAGAWLLRRSRPVWLVGWLGLLALVAAALPQRAFLTVRFLPYWYFALFLLAGLALGLLAERARRRRSAPLALVALALAPLALNGALRAGYMRDWAAWSFAGVERTAGWPLLDGLAARLRTLPPGRVHWEDDAELFTALGSRNVLTLLPYWAPGHDALGGLWYESSLIAPLVAAIDNQVRTAARAGAGDVAWRGIAAELGALGVRYFVAVHPPTVRALQALPGVARLGSYGPLALFQLPVAPLVQTPQGTPPATDIRVTDGEIRFRAAAPGVPHRIVVSFFPNWEAEGAAGPIREGPLMSVVPTRPDVRLRFRPGVLELLGLLLTVLGVLVVGGIAVQSVRPVRPGRDRPSGAGSGAGEARKEPAEPAAADRAPAAAAHP